MPKFNAELADELYLKSIEIVKRRGETTGIYSRLEEGHLLICLTEYGGSLSVFWDTDMVLSGVEDKIFVCRDNHPWIGKLNDLYRKIHV